MARFCGNCGNAVGDTDKVCGRCGTPIPGAAPQAAGMAPQGGYQGQPGMMPNQGAGMQQGMPNQGYQMQPGMAPQQRRAPKAPKAGGSKLSKNAIIGIAAVAVVLVAVIVTCILLFGGGGSYKKAIDKTMKCVEEADAKGLMDLMPQVILDAAEEEMGDLDDATDDLQDELEDYLDDLSDDVGKVQSLSYEITDEFDIDESLMSLASMYMAMSGDMDVDIDDIKAIKICELKITAEGKKKEKTYKKQTIICIKEKGWKTFPLFITGSNMDISEIEDQLEMLEDLDLDDLDF